VTVLLGVDLGDRRIGIALGDSDSGSAIPVLTLRRGTHEQDGAAIGRICAERRADAIVVGLPLHEDGTESEQSRRTREWVAAVVPMVGLPLTLRDERLTSQSAEARLGRAPRGRAGGPPSPAARRARRARIDREAATLIVQAELDALAARDRVERRAAP
jgi:putative Holliday junction resolvase